MKYADKNRFDLLSAEYTFNIMRGKARIRYLKLLLRYPVLRPSLWRWEKVMLDFTSHCPACHPSSASKRQIFLRVQDKISDNQQRL
ncbi:hypothetical protein [Aliiglaciecola sp. M165]|uniref:hypothetical protein n=1 Tax=Aliiglaciecola sp. M165 TaxID=2593649 RepID=UPI00117D5998|nr:hypothetical protein [Aliiglaciecola sp. M165]TRY31458.1 hypothetical protein FM019_11335 [Aliiglaciecola sp. M165]